MSIPYGSRKGLSFKPTLRETIRRNEAACNALQAASGKGPRFEIAPEPVKRARNHSDENDLEAAVKREVAQLLAVHPLITLCVRQNGGTAVNQHGAPVEFYHLVRKPQPMVITDFWGFVNRPQGARPYAVECKRRDWKLSPTNPTAREKEQYAFICLVRSMGGVGGFVTCAEEAQRIVEGK